MSNTTRTLSLLVLSVIWILGLLYWYLLFLVNDFGLYFIPLFSNPNESHALAYIFVLGFFSYPLLVLGSLALAWITRKNVHAFVPVLIMLTPLLSVAAIYGSTAISEAREHVQFEEELARLALEPDDFLCPDGRYLKINERGVVGLVEVTDSSYQDTYAGDIEPISQTFSPLVAWEGWYEDIKGCKNQIGEIFLAKYPLLYDPSEY